MKVFTHYTKLGSTSDGIRWRTILKFGNSWELKGSVVMKNPGAANFKRPDHAAINSPEELKQLSVFDDGELRADWYEFSSDPTMECIGRLFSEYYATKGELLEGVIQIFNLFYLREANLITALNKVSQLNLANMVEYDVQHLIPFEPKGYKLCLVNSKEKHHSSFYSSLFTKENSLMQQRNWGHCI